MVPLQILPPVAFIIPAPPLSGSPGLAVCSSCLFLPLGRGAIFRKRPPV